MSGIADLAALGYLPLQHHEDAHDDATRKVVFATRLTGQNEADLGAYLEADRRQGDLGGAICCPSHPRTRGGALWGFAVPCVVRSRGEVTSNAPGDLIAAGERLGEEVLRADVDVKDVLAVAPIAGGSGDRHGDDARFPALGAFLPRWASRPPVGAPVLVAGAANERAQDALAFPAFHALVAPSLRVGTTTRADDPDRLATRAVDVDDAGAVAPDRVGPVVSLFRLVNMAGFTPAFRPGWIGASPVVAPGDLSLAITLDRGGLVQESPTRGGRVGALAADLGGPLTCGPPGDAHALGVDGDGRPVSPVHLSTRTLYEGLTVPEGPGGDGPLAFERGPYPSVQAQPLRAPVHLQFDRARREWAWWAEVPFYEVGSAYDFEALGIPAGVVGGRYGSQPARPASPTSGILASLEGPYPRPGESLEPGKPGGGEARRIPQPLDPGISRYPWPPKWWEPQWPGPQAGPQPGGFNPQPAGPGGTEGGKGEGPTPGGFGPGPFGPGGGEPFPEDPVPPGGGPQEFPPGEGIPQPSDPFGPTPGPGPEGGEPTTPKPGPDPWEPGGGKRRFVATPRELAVPAILFRPGSLPGLPDLRFADRLPDRDLALFDREAPVVGRLEAVAAADGGVVAHTQGSFLGRYRGGTASGVLALYPPEKSVDEEGRYGAGAPPGVTLSETAFAAMRGARIAVADSIDRKTGLPTTGVRWRVATDGSGDGLWESVGAAGAAEERLRTGTNETRVTNRGFVDVAPYDQAVAAELTLA